MKIIQKLNLDKPNFKASLLEHKLEKITKTDKLTLRNL